MLQLLTWNLAYNGTPLREDDVSRVLRVLLVMREHAKWKFVYTIRTKCTKWTYNGVVSSVCLLHAQNCLVVIDVGSVHKNCWFISIRYDSDSRAYVKINPAFIGYLQTARHTSYERNATFISRDDTESIGVWPLNVGQCTVTPSSRLRLRFTKERLIPSS
jgi:hypothetical protein